MVRRRRSGRLTGDLESALQRRSLYLEEYEAEAASSDGTGSAAQRSVDELELRLAAGKQRPAAGTDPQLDSLLRRQRLRERRREGAGAEGVKGGPARRTGAEVTGHTARTEGTKGEAREAPKGKAPGVEVGGPRPAEGRVPTTGETRKGAETKKGAETRSQSEAGTRKGGPEACKTSVKTEPNRGDAAKGGTVAPPGASSASPAARAIARRKVALRKSKSLHEGCDEAAGERRYGVRRTRTDAADHLDPELASVLRRRRLRSEGEEEEEEEQEEEKEEEEGGGHEEPRYTRLIGPI